MTCKQILVTGGAGYIGSVLIPILLAKGHHVTVLDCFYFGKSSLPNSSSAPLLELVAGDIRDKNLIRRLFARKEIDAVIHLAAISNDPSAELDPLLTEQVNIEGLSNVLSSSKEFGVSRFLYASSASIYGIQDEESVTENVPPNPQTLYAKSKVVGEDLLAHKITDDFVGVSVRSATVCGWSPRLRLDLTLNILTAQAVLEGEIRVFGGAQSRPNVHVSDLADFYVFLLDAPVNSVNGEAFNYCKDNSTILNLAHRVRDTLKKDLQIRIVPTEDLRSYRISAEKAKSVLNIMPQQQLEIAIKELAVAIKNNRNFNYKDPVFRNVEYMKQILGNSKEN